MSMEEEDSLPVGDEWYRDERPCPVCAKRSMLTPEPTWSWPSTVAFIALLASIAFVIWVFFG